LGSKNMYYIYLCKVLSALCFLAMRLKIKLFN
jgi:hypothetical protein